MLRFGCLTVLIVSIFPEIYELIGRPILYRLESDRYHEIIEFDQSNVMADKPTIAGPLSRSKTSSAAQTKAPPVSRDHSNQLNGQHIIIAITVKPSIVNCDEISKVADLSSHLSTKNSTDQSIDRSGKNGKFTTKIFDRK